MDLGDFYQFDDPNLLSCIRYAHLNALDNLSRGPMLSMFKPHKILPSNPDFEKLRPNFGWLPKDVVKATIENSTQWYQGENRFPMRCHIKSRFPAANVNHLPDTVSYDTPFSDTPALDDGIKGHGGCTMIEIFYAKPSQLVYGVPLSAKRNVPDAVKDLFAILGFL